MSPLTITPTTGKHATLAGAVAVRESVSVTVVGGAAWISGGLAVVVCRHGATYAICRAWVVDGANAVGTLDLNTLELAERFEQAGDQESKQFTLLVVGAEPATIWVNAVLAVMNAPYETGMDEPTACASWGEAWADLMDGVLNSANTALTVTPNLLRKTAAFDRVIAVRETAAVRIVAAAVYIPDGLVLALVSRGTLYALCQAWVVDGVDAVGYLDLNTAELVAKFEGCGDQAVKHVTAVGLVITPATVLFNAPLAVMNAPYEAGMADPAGVAAWSPDLTDITDLLADHDSRVEAAEAAVSGLDTRVGLAETALAALVVGGGYTVASGTDNHVITESASYRDLVRFIRTLAATLKAKGII